MLLFLFLLKQTGKQTNKQKKKKQNKTKQTKPSHDHRAMHFLGACLQVSLKKGICAYTHMGEQLAGL